jgi:hypothetical protein
VRVTPLPAQTEEEDAVAETVGKALTVTPTVDVLEHPLASVPVTVYVVVATGLSVTLDPDKDPGIHVYVEAPPALSVTELPIQIALEDAAAFTFGRAFTVTITVEVPVHPGPLEPVTVYVVVEVGETVTVVPVSDPGIHV